MTIHKQISYLYAFFGIFLIACGAVAIDVAGVQAKTALLTGGIGGLIALVAGHFLNRGKRWSFLMGAIEAGILTILLFWRTGTYFIRLLEMVQQGGQGAETTQTAGMAFLLTTAMLVVALLTLAVSVMFAKQVLSETK
ncbi:hypothetical protein [Pontibacter ruber]|uniref:Uncharacterized protein n=1 Tax=Pontibacter ruber TaxID=1343895 RepID=A0ABW5CUS2_9BACT|nr:hypothetical protein [Pontibacter ruber]